MRRDDDVALDDTRASELTIGAPQLPGLEVGKMFRGLKIRGLLGAGAMGQAYLASHVSLRIPVVIKLFRTAGPDPLSEAHLAARIGSPWVVPVLDAGIEQGLPYVMQRYVDGIDFEELLAIHDAADRPIPIAALVRYAVHVFQGLSAIHVAGVVHRDIKPPNLFLAGSGDALVGDLGIAVDPTGVHQVAVAGTPMFIAPELWTGGHATPRTDSTRPVQRSTCSGSAHRRSSRARRWSSRVCTAMCPMSPRTAAIPSARTSVPCSRA